MRTFVPAAVRGSAKTLDRKYYTDPAIFEREREAIFARSWIVVGRLEEVQAPGAFFLAEVAGESLIITRDTAGTIHTFFNVCRHRGTRICEEQRGTFRSSIQCRYHAWTYGLDGRLTVARNMESEPGFNRADYSLHEADTTIVDGFIFVNLQSRAKSFTGVFGTAFDRFAPWELSMLRIARRIVYPVAANWKLIFQNYSECYHCPLVHPQLEKLSASDSGRNDLTSGPMLGGYSTLRENAHSLTTTGTTSRSAIGSVSEEDRRRIYYYTVFPSMLLSLHADYVMVHYVRPVAIDRTEIVCEWLFAPETMAAPDFEASDAVSFWDATNRQDWAVSELTQAGVQSRAYSPGPYSNAEGLLDAFDQHYLRELQTSNP